MHTISPALLNKPIRIVVVGCGGTGSAVAAGLPYLHQALLANGHPYGLRVTLMDGERISATNCVRQPFSVGEIGLFKSVVLVNRLNLFWGVDWEAVPEHLRNGSRLTNDTDFVIGCVDSRAARATIQEVVTASWSTIRYSLDIGNNADTGQFVLGQPLNRLNRHNAMRLRTIVDLYPEIANAALDDDSQPSCSAAESLNRQHAFINQTLANHALALLSRLFRFGGLQYHGAFVSLASGAAVPLRVDPKVWARIRARNNRSRSTGATLVQKHAVGGP